MKKLLMLVGILFLIGCSDPPSSCDGNNRISWDNWDKVKFVKECEKLGKCMGLKATVMHLSSQPHNPYACSLENGKDREHYMGRYIYPLSQYDGFFESISSLTEICEMITETGEWSIKSRREDIKNAEEWLKHSREKKAKKEKQQREEQKENDEALNKIQESEY